MNEQDRINKNNRIKQSLMETKLKRSMQRCLVFELKINTSRLNKTEFEKLKFLFVQCKWLYNYLLNEEVDIFKFDTKTRDIFVLDKDKNKINKTIDIPSKIIQSVHCNLKQNIKSLKYRKEKGYKIGKLKFKSELNCIDLSQYNNIHAIKNNKFRICGFKKLFKVHGLKQIKPKYEIANAKLIQKPSGYYIKLTCFENLTNNRIEKPITEVGLDYGIKTNITTSDNEKFDICIEESERLKGLQKKLARQKKGSNNRYKTIQKIRLEYEKLSNKKKDKTNKLVNYLCTKYSTIYMQDENISAWHKGLYGKQVQHSILGNLKSKLEQQPNVQVINRYYPTTKMCYNCGHIHKDITLNDREFICPSCGFSEDRDLKAAKTILFMGQCKNTYVPVGRRNTNVEKSEMRRVEGAVLYSDLVGHLEQIVEAVKKIAAYAPQVVAEQHLKLQQRVGELLQGIEIDQGRLANELAFFADRVDISEELARLDSHITQFRTALGSEEPVGRQLEFILQELLREINTIGSKSNALEINKLVIAVKSELEKIREQIQNVE